MLGTQIEVNYWFVPNIWIGWFIFLLFQLFIFYKPFRFYCFSYCFSWLYNNQTIAKFLGIRFEDDRFWETTREETDIYIPGFFAKIFVMFTGLPIKTTSDVRKELMLLQGKYAKNISMESYFNEIDGKTMTIHEFEIWLSKTIIHETNRVFKILTTDKEKEFLDHIIIIRTIISGLTGSSNTSIFTMLSEWHTVYKLIKILRSVSGAKRLLLLIPSLSLIDSFSKMITNKNIILMERSPTDFFELTSNFFVVISGGDMVFVHRHSDDKNSVNNRAFGIPQGTSGHKFICPGSHYVMKFINSILSFLKTFDIAVNGDAIISTGRFRNIMNKSNIQVTFTKTSREYIHSEINDFVK